MGLNRGSTQIGAGGLAVRFFEGPGGVLMVEKRVVGDRDVLRSAATTEDLEKYPDAVRAFREHRRGLGTPLDSMPDMTEDLVEELVYRGIRTVQDLVAVDDGHIAGVPNGFVLRRKAKEWLDVQAAEAETAEEREREIEIANLRRRVEELSAELRERSTK